MNEILSLGGGHSCRHHSRPPGRARADVHRLCRGRLRLCRRLRRGRSRDLRSRKVRSVKKGDVLFVLEQAQQQAQLDAAEARVAAAEASVENLTTGSRSEEVGCHPRLAAAGRSPARRPMRSWRWPSVADAQSGPVRQGHRAARQARCRPGPRRADAARPAPRRRSHSCGRSSRWRELPARDAQHWPCRGQSPGGAGRCRARRRADLADRTIVAPAAGRIERIYYAAGEIAGDRRAGGRAAAGRGMLKVKFYVGEARARRPGARRRMSRSIATAARACCCRRQLSRLAEPAVHPAGDLLAATSARGWCSWPRPRSTARRSLLPGQPVTVELAP